MSDVKVPGAGQEILYLELNKGKVNNPQTQIDFSIFEPDKKESVKLPDNNTLMKRYYEKAQFQKEIKLSPSPQSAKKYLQQLRELKAFLKENPKQKSIYRDINIDFLILQTKRKIMYEEEQNHEENRPSCNDFIPAAGIPFE